MTNVYVARPVLDAALQTAERFGFSRAETLEIAALDEEELADPDALVPERAEQAIWEFLVERTGNRGLGIEAGQALSRGTFQAAEYVARTSETVGEALMSLPHLGRLLRSYDLYGIEEDADGLHLLFLRAYDPKNAAQIVAIEAAMMAIISLGRSATGVVWSPRWVAFRHSAPEDTSFYAPLGCEIRFDQPRVETVISCEDAARTMLDADPVLNALITDCAKRRLADLPRGRPIISKVRQALLELLPDKEPSLQAVAHQLDISPRVLQRKLQAEGTNFRTLVENAREEIAKQYLAETSMTAIDVAMLLDYADAPSFYRAFKRWTGLSPGQFRRRVR